MSESAGVLELRLASAPERAGLCGGTLRLDRTKHLVTWAGAPGDIGCKDQVEATFDDVKSVTIEENRPGFVLEFKKGKTKKFLMIPLPDAAWLGKGPKTQEALGTAMTYGSNLQGPDGSSMTASGSAAGAGPTVKKVEVPKEVAANTKKAVDAIKQALEGAKP